MHACRSTLEDPTDDAFGRAVSSALAEIVPGTTRTQKKQDLDREILGHARVFVKSYTIVKDKTDDDRRQLTVAVRVDREKMRARLTELGIATTSETPQEPVVDGAAKGRSVAIALRVTNGEPEAGATAIQTALKGAGYAPKKPTAAGPYDDSAAESFAVEQRAELALLASVTIGNPVPLHGVASEAILVTAQVRLVDGKEHKAIGQGMSAIAATSGDQLNAAIDRALRAAMSDVLPKQQALAAPGTFKGEDVPVAEEGIVLVRVGAKTPLSLVLAEQKFLLGAKGVKSAAIRRLSPNGWIIGVNTTESVEKIASVARKPPVKDTRVTVRVVGSIVEVAIAGAPSP